MNELERSNTIAVRDRFYRKIDRKEDVHNKHKERENACMLIKKTSLEDPLPIMKHPKVYIGHEKASNDGPNQVEKEVC